jgi:hypothetical protein
MGNALRERTLAHAVFENGMLFALLYKDTFGILNKYFGGVI